MKKLTKNILLIVVSLFIFNLANAQTNEWIPFSTTNTGANGLVDNYITAVAVDNDGNIWFGTNGEGVSVFTPPDIWTSYTTANSLLESDNITDIAVHPNTGNIWVTHDLGASEFNGFEWINYYVSGEFYNTITIDADTIWVGNEMGELYRYHGLTWNYFSPTPPTIENAINDIVIDNAGNIWLASDIGVFQFNGLAWIDYSDVGMQVVNAIANNNFPGPGGNIWVGTEDSCLVFFDGFTWSTPLPAGAPPISDIAINNMTGEIWAASSTEGVATSPDGIVWTIFTSANGLVNDIVNSVDIDYTTGIIWFGTIEGVSSYDAGGIGNWINHSTHDGIIDNDVNTIAFDNTGNLWIGTDNGLTFFDETGGVFDGLTNSTTVGGLADNSINSIAVDTAGNIWIATDNGGLINYNATDTWNCYDTALATVTQIADNTINSITIDNNGNIWFATNNGGIGNGDGTNAWTEYDTAGVAIAPIPDNTVNVIFADDNGNIFIGMQTGGLSFGSYLTGDVNAWNTFNTGNSDLPDNCVNAIDVDGATSIIWVGTSNGLAFTGDWGTTWTVFNTGNSDLPDNIVNAVSVDEDGYVWVGTNNGLGHFDGVNNYGWDIYNTSNSGIPDDIINTITINEDPPAKAVVRDVWIGTYGGASRYSEDPVSVKEVASNNADVNIYPNPTKGELYITNAENANIYIYNVLGEIVVSIDTPSNTIDISGLSEGTYIVKILTDSNVITKKINLIK